LEVVKHLPDSVELAVHNIADEHDDRLHDELDEAAGELAAIAVRGVGGELLFGGVEVVVAPELLHKLTDVELELLSVNTSKPGEGKGPAEEGGTESDCSVCGVNLLRLAHVVTFVG